jgi:tRNA-modifying protein YgfZ
MPHQPSPDHAIVTFTGVDALPFLQSQLTHDVAALATGGWQWQGYCSAKGRLHATFALVRTGDDVFAAIVHSSVVEFLVKRLTMFRLRSKVAIERSAALMATLHLDDTPINTDRIATLTLGSNRWITIDERTAATEAPASNESTEFMQAWNQRGIVAMQPEITAATNEMFVPQMIAWDVIEPNGGVSFSKGCYPGQEVVARAHYRGAVKRHLELQNLPIVAEPYAAGQAITLTDGRDAEICNVVTKDSGAEALVVAAAV